MHLLLAVSVSICVCFVGYVVTAFVYSLSYLHWRVPEWWTVCGARHV